MSWDLQFGPERKSFAAWGFGNLTRHLASQAVDRVTFDAPVQTIESDTAFSFGDTVRIFRPDGVKWFQGTVIQTPLTASGTAEFHGYVIAGPWWHLEENVFKQQWTAFGGNVYTGHILLNLKAGPFLASTQEQIQFVLDYILSLYPAGSKPFQTGVIEPAAYPPVSEVNAISCAAAIRSQLRWVPDAVVWFDYSVDPPALNIQQRGSLPAVALQLPGESQVDIVPRSDLVRPSVAIQYERTISVNGVTNLQILNDIAPGGASGQEPRALNLSISLAGPTITITTAELLAEAIAPNSLDWWKTKHEAFRDPRYSAMTISNVKRLLSDVDEDAPEASSQHPRELIEGQIAPWMPFDHEQEVITADFTFDFYDKDPADPTAKKLAHVEAQPMSANLVSTDAETGSYSSSQTTDTGDPLPLGLAQFIYDTLATLHYDGRIAWVLSEIDGTVGMGNRVNLAGGRPEWAGMNALVQQITEEVDTGRTSIEIGPPRHLGAQDLMELLRVGRRFRFTPAAAQASGELGDAGNIRLGKPTANSGQGLGNPPYSLLVVKDGDTLITMDAVDKKITMDQGDGRTVQLDLDDIPSLPDGSKFPIKFRPVIVCDEVTGAKKRMVLLGSDMYDPVTGD